MVYRVTAALFAPEKMFRHVSNKKTTEMISTCKAVNLVQIATLPEWGGRNLGGITLEYVVKKRLQEFHNLVILCGCARKYYLKLEMPFNPSWLLNAPFNFEADPDDPNDDDMLTLTREQYNCHLFFYIVLNETTCESQLANPMSRRSNPLPESKKPKFSFEFDEYLQGYYGGAKKAARTDENVQTDENTNPN